MIYKMAVARINELLRSTDVDGIDNLPIEKKDKN